MAMTTTALMIIVTVTTTANAAAAAAAATTRISCNAAAATRTAAWILNRQSLCHNNDAITSRRAYFSQTRLLFHTKRSSTAFSFSGRNCPRKRTFFLQSSSSSTCNDASTTTTTTTEQEHETVSNTSPSSTPLPLSKKGGFVPYPFAYRQELELRIETLTNRGWGIGRVDIPPVSSPIETPTIATHDNLQQPQQQQQRRNHRQRQRRRGKSREKQNGRDQEESEYIEAILFDYNNNNQDCDDNNDNVNSRNSSRNRPWVVMVPAVIPGELVMVRVHRNFKSYSHADLISILEPSPHRVTPRCPLHTGCASTTTVTSGTTDGDGGRGGNGGGGSGGDCGGCQLQHMTIDLQRYWKTRHVVEGIRQYGFSARSPPNTLDLQDFQGTTSARDKDNKDDTLLVSPCLGTSEIYGYRSKLTPHYDQPRKASSHRRRGHDQQQDENENEQDNNVKRITAIGFQRQTMRQIVDVPNCPIATTAINVAYQELRKDLLSRRHETIVLANDIENNDYTDNDDDDEGDNEIGGRHNGKMTKTNKKKQQQKVIKGATLLLRQGNVEDTHVETDSRAFLTTTVRGLDFTYRAGNFFQNNYYILPIMVQHVIEAVLHGGGGGGGGRQQGQQQDQVQQQQSTLKYLVDCYCGSGLFAISAAPCIERVAGIEINEKAILEASANAMANNITNCDFKCATAEQIFESLQPQNSSSSSNYNHDASHHHHYLFDPNETVVILDPPRKGCSVDFLEQLQRYGPARVVYVSCDPTTQARDAAILVGKTQKQQQQQQQEASSNDDSRDSRRHGAMYKITSIQPMDLFPQTRHIECVMVFERSDR